MASRVVRLSTFPNFISGATFETSGGSFVCSSARWLRLMVILRFVAGAPWVGTLVRFR